MTLTLDRVEIESAGSDPIRLARALLRQLPPVEGAVPIREIALALDIVEIVAAPLASLEGCLQCDALKSEGQIVVNAGSSHWRKRYTIAHELGHFLNERHRPTSPFGFDCTADDMGRPQREGRRFRQEREANTFAIEVLTPRPSLAQHLSRAADLEHALAISERFDVSRETAIRRYVALHDETLAAVFTRNGQIRYIDKSERFPSTSVWTGDPAPGSLIRKVGERLTSMDEVEASAWLTRPDGVGLYAQTLFQANGFACTLLIAETDHDDEDWEPPRFRR